jgi:hypothetical protein
MIASAAIKLDSMKLEEDETLSGDSASLGVSTSPEDSKKSVVNITPIKMTNNRLTYASSVRARANNYTVVEAIRPWIENALSTKSKSDR